MSVIFSNLSTKVTALSGGDKIQSGSGNVTIAVANTGVAVPITFPVPFATVPKVMVTMTNLPANNSVYTNLIATSATINGFSLFGNCGAAQTIPFDWVAVGT